MRPVPTLLAVAVAGAAAFILLGNSAEGPARGAGGAEVSPAMAARQRTRAVPVHAAVVVTRDLNRTLEVTGTLKTDEDVQISSRLAGKVAGVHAKEGDRVRQGQLLLRLDDRELRAQLARSRALLASANARLSLARNQATWKDTAAQETYRRARSAVDAAKTRVSQAKLNADLIASETKTNVETAQANVAIAKDRLAVARETTRKQERRAAELLVEQAQAQAAQARVDEQNVAQSLARRRVLFQQDAIAKEEVEEAERQHKSAGARVKIADAAVEAARQQLDLAVEGTRPEEIRIFIGRLLAAERALNLARSEERRAQLAQDDVSAAEAVQEQAEAALRTAEAGLAQKRMSQDDIETARATIEQTAGEIAVLTTQLSDLAIRAPVAGVVSRRLVHAGEMVTAGGHLMDLVSTDAVYLEAQVPELEVHLLRPGARAEVTVDAIAGRTFAGAVREIIPVAQRQSKAFRVRVAVLGRTALPVGGYARAALFVGARPNAMVVPQSAVQSESGEKYVWVIDGSTDLPVARRQAVRVGLSDGRDVEVLDGLQTGQQVVTDPSRALEDGIPLDVVG